MGFSESDCEEIRSHTELGKCLKEQYLVATLNMSDSDFCHILEIHWFQTGKELAGKPIVTLIQEALGELTFEDLYPYCEHVDWSEMY